LKKTRIRVWVEDLTGALILALIIRCFLIQAFKIPTGSMEDTLLVKDHILVNKLKYIFTEPKRGEVIIFKCPENPYKDYIKRVIAIPGDTIEIVKKNVFVNGRLISEPYKVHKDKRVMLSHQGSRDYLKELKIPAEGFFVMGDNRDTSYDSRFWGCVKRDLIKGKALCIYWPLWRIRLIR
jgi:signal peptidase I